jgi:poly(A) polymerase
MTQPVEPTEIPLRLSPEYLDPDAVEMVEILTNAGFTTFLVGGCVRDALLKKTPKDFDIATSARPEEIKRLFRGCRLIGRRFILAHVYRGTQIFEVATFRGRSSRGITLDRNSREASQSASNTFGTPAQDALSRDFTINGLFYDPLESKVIDYIDGYNDIEKRILTTIGDPNERLEEDPVRILRAVKFGARLEFDIPGPMASAMRNQAPMISKCSTPRVTEEVMRIAESKSAKDAFRIMNDTGVLDIVLPEHRRFLTQGNPGIQEERARQLFTLLQYLDRMGDAHGVLPRTFVLPAIYYPLAYELTQEKVNQKLDWGQVTADWFYPIGVRMQIPVRWRNRFQTLMSMMQRMLDQKNARRYRRARAMVRQRAFPQALSLLRLHIRIYGTGEEAYNWWGQLAREEGITSAPILKHQSKSERDGRSRDRGKGGRGSRGGRGGQAKRRGKSTRRSPKNEKP